MSRYIVSFMLKDEDRFDFAWTTDSRNGMARARWVTYQGGSSCSLSGSTINKDGQLGLVDRAAVLALHALPRPVLLRIEQDLYSLVTQAQRGLAEANKAILAQVEGEET